MRQERIKHRAEAQNVHYVSSDEVDELPPPRLLNRYCGAKACRRRARSGGRHCALCHAASVRRWREGHAQELAVRRRDAAEARSDLARARDSARAKLAMALRRGKIVRGHCVVCGSKDVMALIEDVERPLDVVWACRADRELAREQRSDAAAKRAAAAEHEKWVLERARVLAEIELLDVADRERLYEHARHGPAGLRLSLESPLFAINLVRAFTMVRSQ